MTNLYTIALSDERRLQPLSGVSAMASAMVRINPETHAKLKELSEHFGEPMPAVLDKAIEAFRRQHFLKEANKAFAALRADPKAWAQELKERAAWDKTLMDGLEDD